MAMLRSFVRTMSCTTTPTKYWMLFYKYVPNVVEARAPFRPAHLQFVSKFKEDGTVILGGAFADPVDGAAIVFKGVDKETVENFAKADPYVVNKIVTEYNIREWTVVVSGQ